MENNLVFDGNQGIAQPAGDIINIIGDGTNVQTSAKGNTLIVSLGDSPVFKSVTSEKISLPKTSPAGQEGAVWQDGKVFMHSFSTGAPSVYLGADCGNVSLASQANVAVGAGSLNNASGANFNTALSSLQNLVTGNFNTGIGYQSLGNLKNGAGNTSLGAMSSYNISGAFFNTTIGTNAGLNYSSQESYNVILGCTAGQADESYVMRLGNDGSVSGCPATQKTFITGVSGNVVDGAMPVFINPATGQLGTQGSTQTIKTNIKSISSGSDLLHKLNPVSFNFKGIAHDVVHYGFLAEEVAKFMPELVSVGSDGKPTGVKYMEIIALLVNEVQKLKKMVDTMQDVPAKVLSLEYAVKNKQDIA